MTKNRETFNIREGFNASLVTSKEKDILGIALEDHTNSYFAVEVTLPNKENMLSYTAIKHR